jgi:hypothetical protein
VRFQHSVAEGAIKKLKQKKDFYLKIKETRENPFSSGSAK